MEKIDQSYKAVGGIECVREGSCDNAGDHGITTEEMQELCYLCNQCDQHDPFM